MTQGRGVAKEPDPLGQGDGRAQPAPELEGKHPAVACHLPRGEGVMWMALQPGIHDARHARVVFEETSNLQGALAVAFHAQRQGDQAALDEPGVKGA